MSKKPTKANRPQPAVVPPLPRGYRNGRLPVLPPRSEIVSVVLPQGTDTKVSGLQPDGIKVTPIANGQCRVEIVDPAVAEVFVQETQTRDRWADVAFCEMLSTIEGQPLTDDLLHALRMRFRQLADDVHCLTRIAAARVYQRERVRKRCKVDPVDVCRLVEVKIQAGATVLDALIQTGEETGRPESTVRKAYYKHRKTRTK